MVYWIARRRAGKFLDFDDLKNELWYKALKVLEKTGDYNLDYVAVSCYNYATDLYRKAERKLSRFVSSDVKDYLYSRDGFFDFYDGSFDENDIPTPTSTNRFNKEAHLMNMGSKFLSENNEDYSSSVIINDILKLFSRDSKEYMFVRLLALYFDIPLSDNERDGWRFEDFFSRDRYENSMAKALGFANDTSSGYRSLRARVRNTLTEHGFHDLLLVLQEK